MQCLHNLQEQLLGIQCLISSLNVFRVCASLKDFGEIFQILAPINFKDSVP